MMTSLQTYPEAMSSVFLQIVITRLQTGFLCVVTFFIYSFGQFRCWNLKVALGPSGLRRVRSHMLRRWKERRLGTFTEEEAYGCTTQYSHGFDVANTNKDWVLSLCSSWNTGGFWRRLTEHPLCRTLLVVVTEGKESMIKHELTFKASDCKHITFAQSKFWAQ